MEGFYDNPREIWHKEMDRWKLGDSETWPCVELLVINPLGAALCQALSTSPEAPN